jgi:hypothetical protein
MISVIVCSRQPSTWDFHQRNVEKTIGCGYEYVRVDNSAGTYGICAAYNNGVEQARGDLLVFVHEDVFFMEPGWGNVLQTKFAADPGLGLVGVAGTQYLSAQNALWISAGQPFIKGRVVHQSKDNSSYLLTVFSTDKTDAAVVVVDGLFFAIPKKLFGSIRFDEETFPGFHFYDLDICMQVRRTHTLMVTWDILVKHFSGGNVTAAWIENGKRFLEKYKNDLPASCTTEVPDPANYRSGGSYDLMGKADLGIIT